MERDSRYRWYILDVTVFLLINIIVLSISHIDPLTIFQNLNWFTLFIFALGVWRLTDIITQEDVTNWLRAPFMDRVIIEGAESYVYSKEGLRGFWGALFSCNACMGVWMSMITFYLYILLGTPFFVFMIIMALTGFERFFSKIENVLASHGTH